MEVIDERSKPGDIESIPAGKTFMYGKALFMKVVGSPSNAVCLDNGQAGKFTSGDIIESVKTKITIYD